MAYLTRILRSVVASHLVTHKSKSFSIPSRRFAEAYIIMSKFYALKAERPNGEAFECSDLKGKVVLVVNVASKCGFTKQYKGLQSLFDKYREKDFVIMGFPSNQFGGQEPGTDEEIAQFCTLNHGVTFPLMKKSDVNGDDANEVFKWLKAEKPESESEVTPIRWNFEKFLVDKAGNVVERWSPKITPEEIDQNIANLV